MPHELITFFKTIQLLDLIIIGLVVLIWLLLLFFNLRFYLRLALHKIKLHAAAGVPVTILMVERNEQENLEKNLPGWLSMEYPPYDLLVVDDFSEDNSLSVLGTFRQQFPKLKLTRLNQETRYSQKLSRNIALKAATNDVVVFAVPSMEMPDPRWLPQIGGSFEEGKNMVAGYSAINPSSDYYHTLYRIESFYQQMESMAMCLNGLPFVATEENIAFRKKAYFDINGFAGKIREEYLNMELVLNKVIRKKEVAILPDGSLGLRREMSVDKHVYRELLHKSYRLKRTLRFGIRFILSFFTFLQMIWLPTLIIVTLLYPVMWLSFIILLVILSSSRMFIIKRLLNRMKEPKIFISSLAYGWLIPYYKLVSRWRFNSKRKK